MPDAVALIRELVAIPGPPGHEEAVRAAVESHARALGYACQTDAKGNLLVPLPGLPKSKKGEARVVVTAHLDEIGLMVTGVERDGVLRVTTLGGLYPFKWGEQPVVIMAREIITGVISFGSVHTESPASAIQQARTGPLHWDQAFIFTGLPYKELLAAGVRPGTRVALAPERRTVTEFGPLLGSYFLDDRADLAAWLLALEQLRGAEFPGGVVFAATASEEIGGHGALYLLRRLLPEVCIALEIGPSVPESRFYPDENPTIWVHDSYSPMAAADLELFADLCAELGIAPHWQPLSRGGSDATIAASNGLAARPITLGLPVENSHGYELMHRDAPHELARLLTACLHRIKG